MTELDSILAERIPAWEHLEDLPESNLLRKALLRDLFHEFHRRRSIALASNDEAVEEKLVFFKKLEDALLSLIIEENLSKDLKSLLLNTKKKKSKPLPELPAKLLESIGKRALLREDRIWEATLAAEADQLGWQFWEIHFQVNLIYSSPFDEALRKALWPSGLVLFVETADTPPKIGIWSGRWILILNPTKKEPAQILHEIVSEFEKSKFLSKGSTMRGQKQLYARGGTPS